MIDRVILAVALALYHTEPLFQEFSLADQALWHAHYPDANLMSPLWLLVLTTVVFPVISVFITSIISIWKWPRKLWDFHIYCLSLLGVMAFQFSAVVLIKNWVGRPRPDLLARCQPFSMTFPPIGTLANIIVCTNNNLVVLWDGFRSFPSGHASSKYLIEN